MSDVINLDNLDDLLNDTNLEKVTADGAGFSELTPGYYLCEVEKAELTTNSKNLPMAKFTLKVLADGLYEQTDENGNIVEDENGAPIILVAEGTKDRKIFKNFTLSDSDKVKRFVSDMLKFEDPAEPGKSCFDRAMFKSTESITQVLEASKTLTIFVKGTAGTPSKEYPEPSNFYSFVKWDTVNELGLLDLINFE